MRPPRHPEVHVALHSRNPYAWVSSVRQALRTSGAPREEIHRFSSAALSGDDAAATWQVVSSWVEAELL